MKKMMFLFAAVIMMSSTVMAQRQQQTPEERSKAAAERVTRATERMSRELGLEGDAKTEFETIYKKYMEELNAAAEQEQTSRGEDRRAEQLSNDDCYRLIAENLARQERQITVSQKRLEITKKYMSELLPMLTAQQLYKVFGQRQQYGNGQQNANGQRNWNGNGQRGQGGFGGGQRGGFGGGF